MTDQPSDPALQPDGPSAPAAGGAAAPPARANPLTAEAYGVVLDAFEGPLDLLLFLIRKNEVDIYDIPVATITTQYLEVVRQVRLTDLEGASDFVLMAATLMKIKSQMLLPREIMPEMEDGQGDPRQELVRRLLEYQQFKEVAEWLGVQGLEQRDVYPRGRAPDDTSDGEAVLHQVNLFDLLQVYKHVLDNVDNAFVHRVVEEQVTIEACIELVLGELDRRSRLRFIDLVSGQTREAMVATFIGVLELLKSQRIIVQQARPFDDIWIESRPKDETDTATGTGGGSDAGAAETTADDGTARAHRAESEAGAPPAGDGSGQ